MADRPLPDEVLRLIEDGRLTHRDREVLRRYAAGESQLAIRYAFGLSLAELGALIERAYIAAGLSNYDFSGFYGLEPAPFDPTALDPPQSDGPELSEAQRDFLIASGVFTGELLNRTRGALREGRLTAMVRQVRAETIDDAFTAGQMADRNYAEEVSAGALYSFVALGERRYPIWQFARGTPASTLPGLSRVLRVFPPDWDPANARAFMTTPQEDLELDGTERSPVDWLLAGGDPQAVVDVLVSAFRW